MSAIIITGEIFEDGGGIVLAHVANRDGVDITQAALTGITCTVFDESLGSETPIAEPVITVADVVFDTLQTDNRWTKNTTGYNFAHDLVAGTFTVGDRMYRGEYVFDPVSGTDFLLVVRLYAHRIWGS